MQIEANGHYSLWYDDHIKSVAVCGSKKYEDEISIFCRDLVAHGVLVFEPNIQQPIQETDTFGSDYVTENLCKGSTIEHFDWFR